MTATPTPLRELARDIHYALAEDGALVRLSGSDYNKVREIILRVLTPERIAALSARDEAGADEALAEVLDLAARAEELAKRLVASGPKAAHVSCSETHEISEWILAAAPLIRRLAAVAPEGMVLTGHVSGYLPRQQAIEIKADAPLPAWLTSQQFLRVTLAAVPTQPAQEHPND